MKKTAKKHSLKIDFNEFFSKNIGALGLIVVILLFVIYLFMQKMTKLENKVIQMEASTQETTEPSKMEDTSKPTNKTDYKNNMMKQ